MYGKYCHVSGVRLTIHVTVCIEPVTVGELSKACIVFARSEAGIVGSNPTQGMGV
jgi:hypothetical protein